MSFILEAGEFFKREEKLPFSYSAIEERRTNPNYSGWIVGVVLFIFFSTVIYFLLR